MLENFMDFFDRLPLFNFTGDWNDLIDNFPTDPDIEVPPDWEIPDFEWDGELPEGWEGELPPFIPGELPEGFEIPEGWLPEGLDPSIYGALALLALGLFGTEAIKVWVNSTPPNKYWRLTSYDTFNNSNWVQSDDTISNFEYTSKSPIPSGEKYLVWMNISYQRNGSGSLPLPLLWPTGEFEENVTVISPATINWSLITDQSDSVVWNATISEAPPSMFTTSIIYNATFDDTVTSNSIYSNMISQIVDGTPFDPPGTDIYRQIPTLDPIVVADMEEVKNSVISQGLDLYNACLAVLEYFKTRYSWVSYVNRTTQFNATSLLDLGYGTSADFASNFALYLRYLNISTRLVWGGTGYTKDTSSPTANDMYRLSPTFYTEVWIPNSTNTGGNWLQLDPAPVPKEMFGMTGPMSFDPIYPRIPDDRMETYHYILSLLTNTSDYHLPINHLNRNSDAFELNATLYRDMIPISQTMLGDIVNFNFSDETDNELLGNNGSIGATLTGSFDDNSLVGPHNLNASFHAITNKTIIVLNGSTSIDIDSYNIEPIRVKRGSINNFSFIAKLYDPISNGAISGGSFTANISSSPLIVNNPYHTTNNSGIATMDLSVDPSTSAGERNMTVIFNGTFFIESPYPFIPFDLVYIPGANSISENHTIIVETDILISVDKDTQFQNEVLVRNNNVTILGNVTFDNETAIPNAPVDIHWQNSSGEFIFGPYYTNSSGWYNFTNYIPKLHDSNVLVWANTSMSYGNKTSELYYYQVHCQDTTIVQLYDPGITDYIVRNQTLIQIAGYLIDPNGVADTSGQEIYLYDNNTGNQIAQVETETNGNFSSVISVPVDIPTGYHDIYATFNGTWQAENGTVNIISSASNSSDYNILIVAKTLLVKDTSSYEEGYQLNSDSIPIGGTLLVYGNLVLDNHTALSTKTVNAWETFQNGTTIHLGSDITNSSGFYNVSYLVPLGHPAENTTIFVNYSAGNIYTSYHTNATAIKDPEYYYLCDLVINTVSPSAAIRGLTNVFIQGTLTEIYFGTILEGETMFITFDSVRAKDSEHQEVYAQIDGSGAFSTEFVVSDTFNENDYIVNATPASTGIKYHSATTSNIMLNASSEVSQVNIAQTPIAGESLNISGSLNYENGSKLSGQIIVYPESDPSLNTTLLVNGRYNISFPVGASFADTTENLIVRYEGISRITGSSSSTPVYIGSSPTITLDVPSTAYYATNFNVYGSITQDSKPYFNRSVLIYVSNSTHQNILNTRVNTDINGDFQTQISIPYTGNFTIKANLSSIGSYSSSELFIEIVENPTVLDFLWVLWIILPVVIGVIIVIVGVKLMARRSKKKKQKRLAESIEANSIKKNIQALCDGDRYKEAIIYAYTMFLEIVGIFRGKKRLSSQTIREFAMDLVKNMKLPPKNVYSFTSLYEEARFSDHKIDKNKFEEAKILYDALVSPFMKRATIS
jgi:hypothetical protein